MRRDTSDYPAPVVNGKYYPFAKLTPRYGVGYGPSCPDCDEPYVWHGGPVAIRQADTDRFLASVCRDCADACAKQHPAARWERRAPTAEPSTLLIP